MDSIFNWADSPVYPWAGQLGVGLILILGFLYSPVQAFLSQLPRLHLSVLAILLGLMLLGQVLDQSRLIYPLVSWDMFSLKADLTEVTATVLIGITERNERIRLSLPEIFPLVHFVLPSESDPTFVKIVQATAKAYNLNHPDTPVVKVEVGTLRVPVGAPKEPEWTPLFTVGLDPSKS